MKLDVTLAAGKALWNDARSRQRKYRRAARVSNLVLRNATALTPEEDMTVCAQLQQIES